MSENGGDREMVLGNKQLLAIFFVAVLLCGVFFAVGYVVGGNSAKSSLGVASDGTTTTVNEGKREEPSAADSASSSASPAPDPGAQVPSSEPHMADNPASSGSTPAASSAQPYQPPVQTAPPPTVASAKTPDVSSASSASGVFLSVPEKGASYVQVIATARPHADDLVKSLREAKLPAILSESSKPPLFKVLVGPYRAPLPLADAKRKLTDLGFNGLVVYKP